MPGFNWFDFVIIVCLLVGMVIGYSQGLVRQLIGFAVLYVALVLATQFFRVLSQTVAGLLQVAPNTMFNMVAFFTLFLLTSGVINIMAQDAYKSTRIRLVPFIDHTAGMILGVLSMWLVLSVSVSVMAFATGTQTWLQGESVRQILGNGLDNSRLASLTESTLPIVIMTIQPWLPSGLPALFQF